MNPIRSHALRRIVLAATLAFAALPALHAATQDEGPQALRAKYTQMAERLAINQFQRPLVIDSTETSSELSGDVYAVVDAPFATTSAGLKTPDNWCEVLILHLNTKYCRAGTTPAGAPTLAVSIGKKQDQPLAEAFRVNFAWQLAAARNDYMEVRLAADSGPLSTRDYRITFEAVPADGGKTFLHLRYSYGYGFASKVAMQAYLATVGRGKVGFTITGKEGDGQPAYIDGMRGVVERNTMRYYLAIDAYLASLSAPPAEQLEKRLQAWFTATERYPKQLREVDRATYLATKRNEVGRQQTAS